MDKNIAVSTKTLLAIAAFVVLGALLYLVREVILQLLVAAILALSIEHGVKMLVARRVPRPVASGLFFVILVSVIAAFATVVFPVVIEQTRYLLVSIPDFASNFIQSTELKASLTSSITQASAGVFTVTFNVFSNALNVLSVFVFTLYLSLDMPNLRRLFLSLFAEDLRGFISETWEEIERGLFQWIKGQSFLMLLVGLMTFGGLTVLRAPYAIPIAIISGTLEVVPILGPLVTAVVGAVVGFSVSPLTGISILGVLIAVQQIENNIVIPRVMKKAVGFNPIITMMALLIGGKLFGVVGALMSLPTVLIISVLVTRGFKLNLEN